MVPNQGISVSGNTGTTNSKKPFPSEHLECLIKYNKHTLKCTAELIRHRTTLKWQNEAGLKQEKHPHAKAWVSLCYLLILKS